MSRRKPTDPVTVAEVSAATLRMLVAEFGRRPMDGDTARHGLAHAAHELITLELRTVAATAAKKKARHPEGQRAD